MPLLVALRDPPTDATLARAIAQNVDDLAAHSGPLVIVKADWCPYCKRLEPLYQRFSDVTTLNGKSAEPPLCVTIDFDHLDEWRNDHGSKIARSVGNVKSVPFIAFKSNASDNSVIAYNNPDRSADAILSFLENQLKAQHRKTQ